MSCQRLLFLFLLIVVAGPSLGQAAPPRNVLLLISDNQNWDDLGCYGNTVVQTPHIDRLAKAGVRFSHAFATTASCGPSRAVIYSGLHVHQNGQYGHGHGIHTFTLMPKVQTIFRLLQDGGYRTALLGKQHVTPLSLYPLTFNPRVGNRDVMGLAKAGAEFINQSEDPFFLVVAYHDPHPTSIERPGWGVRQDYDGVQRVEYDPAEVLVPRYLPDQPEVREGLAGYYQQISRMDAGVGAILQALDESGKRDDTLVIFTSDHGSSEPGAMANHYDPGVRVPFIVRHPHLPDPPAVNHAMVTLADIVPTILDWTGMKGPPYELPGRSFLPILGREHADGWDEVFLSHVCHEATMYYPMRTIRTRRHKLIWNVDWRSEFPQPIHTLDRAPWQETLRRGDRLIGQRSVHKFLHRDEIELYDLEADPDEVVNLADNPRYATLKRELSEKLLGFVKRTNDPWMLRHDIPGVGQDEPSPAFLHRRVASTPQRPNVVLVFVDNVGFGDLGCYGNKNVKTPHIDALAAQGVRCTSFYVGSPSCMPSRGALLTGRHPLRTGLNEQLWKDASEDQIALPHRERLLPEYLRTGGYVSGCFGKWNIGFAVGSRPTDRGFDEFFGHASGNMHYYNHVYDGRHDLYRGTEHAHVEGYCTDLFADAACDFIRRHADRPFLCYVPFNAAHYPNRRNHKPDQPVIWQAPAKYFHEYGWNEDEPDEKRRYLAVLTALDEGIGRIVKQIDESRLADNTLLIVLSDNGAFMLPSRGLEVASNLPLRDGGVTLWEGGIRVPCIVRWPGRLPEGTVCDEPLVSMDLLPLILNVADVAVPAHRTFDGYDPLAALSGRGKSPHEFLAFRWSKMSSLRAGSHKIIRNSDDDPWQLYDLAADLAETTNLAKRHPDVVARLASQFAEWEVNVAKW